MGIEGSHNGAETCAVIPNVLQHRSGIAVLLDSDELKKKTMKARETRARLDKRAKSAAANATSGPATSDAEVDDEHVGHDLCEETGEDFDDGEDGVAPPSWAFTSFMGVYRGKLQRCSLSSACRAHRAAHEHAPLPRLGRRVAPEAPRAV
jgi:hypothetical protein